jgi:S1-C subfamily serine protease
MRFFGPFFLGITIATSAFGNTTSSTTPIAFETSETIAPAPLSFEESVSNVYKMHQNSVVEVRAVIQQPGKGIVVRANTGFCISEKGHILTTFSGIDQAKELWIGHCDQLYWAETIACDTRSNLAIVKLVTRPGNMTWLDLKAKVPHVSVADFVVSLSRPLYCPTTPRCVLLSGYEGHLERTIFPTHYWRLNTSMIPGEEGSPVFNLKGELIGLFAITSPQMQSTYVLPVSALSAICNDLMTHGKVPYGRIGLEVEDIFRPQTGHSIIVSSVDPSSNAHAAGIREGDELLWIGEQPIRTIDDVHSAAFLMREGQSFSVRMQKPSKEIVEYKLIVGPST